MNQCLRPVLEKIAILNNRMAFINASCGVFVPRKAFILQRNLQVGFRACSASKARIGFTVTKKVGKAVIRNRIRRRLREAVNKIEPNLLDDGYDYVLVARPDALTLSFSVLCLDIETAIKILKRGAGKKSRLSSIRRHSHRATKIFPDSQC